MINPDEFNTVLGWDLRGRSITEGEPAYMKVVALDGSELPLYHRDQTRPATLEEALAEGAKVAVHPPPLASLS
jgi:hypothetical protein